MWHFNPLLNKKRLLRCMLVSADAVPNSLQQTVLFAIFEAKAKNQTIVDDCHLLLAALRELKDRSGRFMISPTATRDQLPTGPAVEGLHDLSPKAKAILARCSTPEEVVEQLRN
jgi:hypothetical protein